MTKIVNHTEVNWMSGDGKNMKKNRSISSRDPNDSSEENENKPKTWADVVRGFNQMNNDSGLAATGDLDDSQYKIAEENYRKFVAA